MKKGWGKEEQKRKKKAGEDGIGGERKVKIEREGIGREGKRGKAVDRKKGREGGEKGNWKRC